MSVRAIAVELPTEALQPVGAQPYDGLLEVVHLAYREKNEIVYAAKIFLAWFDL